VSYKDSKIYPRSASRYLISVDGTRVADKILPADHGPFKLQGPPVDTLTDIRVPGGRRELMFEVLQLTGMFSSCFIFAAPDGREGRRR
jgi:hypothetical protein